MDRVEDRISALPDDILLSLISPMGLKEAAKTSILSRRWRYVWANWTHLDFNHLVVFPNHDPDAENLYPSVDEKSKYVKWISQVVGVHCGPCIDSFKVSFRFDGSDAQHIEKWVRFAISKKVKDLELNLISGNSVCAIGFDILKPSLSPSGDSNIDFLTSLHLTKINVSGEVLEFLLSRCRLLERLDVRGSRTLVTFKVGPTCKLKQLTIRSCANLQELEIDAANLIYFDFICTTSLFNLLLQNTPVLAEVKVLGWAKPNTILPPLFQLAGQFSKLSFGLLPSDIPGGILPTFSSVKQLNLLIMEDDVGFDLVAITTLLEACPAVCEFKIEIDWMDDDVGLEAYELSRLDLCLVDEISDDDEEEENLLDVEVENAVVDIVVPQVQRKTHPSLKVLHVAGFNGAEADVDLILYFVDFTCNLETIVCDFRRCFSHTLEARYIEASRNRAAKLMKIVPPNIHVEII